MRPISWLRIIFSFMKVPPRLLIKLILARIQLSKKLFLLDIETGYESYISGDIN